LEKNPAWLFGFLASSVSSKTPFPNSLVLTEKKEVFPSGHFVLDMLA
jgi:hypothetical protein